MEIYSWENHRKMNVYPLVNCHITNWKDPPFLMGKLTTSTGPFSIAMLVYQRLLIFGTSFVFWKNIGPGLKQQWSSFLANPFWKAPSIAILTSPWASPRCFSTSGSHTVYWLTSIKSFLSATLHYPLNHGGFLSVMGIPQFFIIHL